MHFLKWLPVVLWAGLILASANDHLSSTQTGGWLSALFGGEVPYVLHVILRKLGHVLAYGILGALTWRADRRLLVVLGVVLAVASVDEWMQSHTTARTGTPWDVVLDVTAAAIVFAILRRRM